MNEIVQRIDSLRDRMKHYGLGAYIIPSWDYHQSEYVADYFKARTWISGFTGSAGTVVITDKKAGLWTDGRYFIQAAKQIENTGIELFKIGEIGVPSIEQWLLSELDNSDVVGFDNKVFSIEQATNLKNKMILKGIDINGGHDLIQEIWNDRGELPAGKVYLHDIEYCGKSSQEKMADVRKKMTEYNAEYYIISSLDNIAWLFNIRGNDIKYNPVVYSFAVISQCNSVLYINMDKLDKHIINALKEQDIEVSEYSTIDDDIKLYKQGSRVLLDPSKNNNLLYSSIPNSCEVIFKDDIVTYLKAIKNDTEIANLRECHNRDNVAMVKFLCWLDNTIGKEYITEISASDKLASLRSQLDRFIELSFDTIAAYNDHGPMMHYKAEENTQYELKPQGFYLVDSGAQFLDGTTDITRTISLGELTNQQKRDFTMVLKSHIALANARFLYGICGSQLDMFARIPMWKKGIDYKSGTGHGVGFCLNVHEGPQRICMRPFNTQVLEEGMVMTDEPGIYREGKYGIRTENTILVVKDEENEFGQFMKLEVLSYCPIDIDAIDCSLLDDEEKAWINQYHKKTYDIIAPKLNEKEKMWLKNKTRAL